MLYRCGIESSLPTVQIIGFWQQYSNDVRFIESRECSKHDKGTRKCPVGVIVCCGRFGDKIGHINKFKDWQLKVIDTCGIDDRQALT